MDYTTSYSVESNSSKDDTAVANELLKRVNLPAVSDLSECTSSIFVSLCEGILGDPLQGISYVPVTKEDEIHNVQLVIDHLADKVLHCDLSHISGRAVVEGDRVAMQYLLEILLGVMDYIMEGIDSEGSTTDFEDGDLMDPDTMTRGTVSAITDVLREELGPTRSKDSYYRPPSSQYERPNDSHTISDISKHLSQPNSQSEGDSTAELIKLGTKGASSQDVPQRDNHTPAVISTSDPVRHGTSDGQPFKVHSYLPAARIEPDGIPTRAPSSCPKPLGVVDSTTGSPGKQRDDLTLQDLSGSFFSSVSWPKPPPPPLSVASDHQPLNEFDTLGMRPRPAFTKDRPVTDVFGTADSLIGSLRDSGPLHHVHTHHHYHRPVNSKPSTGTVPPRSPSHATLSRPPPSGQTSSADSSPSRGQSSLLELQDKDLPSSSHYRQTYPAALHSTYPAPSEHRPTTSASLRGVPSTRGYPSVKQQGNVFIEDADEGVRRPPRRDDEHIFPPRPRRVAFEDDVRIRSQRSFYRETLDPIASYIRNESSDSDQDSDLDVLSQCSDSAVDYRQQGTSYPVTLLPGDPAYLPTRDRVYQSSRAQRDQPYDLRPRSKPAKEVQRRRPPHSRPKSVLLPVPSTHSHRVRFEEALEADATGPMHRIRKKLNKENRKQSRQKEVLRYVYEGNLQEAKSGLTKQMNRNKRVLDKQDAEYRKVFKGPKTSKYQPADKYNTKITSDRLSRSKVMKSPNAKRKRSASSSPTMHRHKRLSIGEDEMLPTVMQEFPFLHVSPQTSHDMWAKQMRQMEQLTKMGLDQQYKKTKTQLKMEEAEKRQDILLGIMKKEMGHNQRMREIKERRAKDRALQNRAQEQRQVNARARRYYDEFRLRSRSRMMKKRTREEQIFKRLFEDGLKIQKARIHDLRNYAKEKREESSKRQQDEIDSLENYYRNQFSMLAEAIATERYELQVRDKAQTKVMDKMKRDMRRKMEQEIRDVQEQMYQDEDTEYFRQLEADRMRRELQMASYKTML